MLFNLLKMVMSTNHINIGLFYIMSGLIGGSIGFGLSVILSLELSLPGYLINSSSQYNSIISFHGLVMIFFMMMPMLIGGFGNLLMPLMLCSSDMIFPRLNAISFWLVMESLLLIISSIIFDGGINCGWTFYIPLSLMNYSSIDLLFFSLHLVGLSSLLGSINFISTLFKASNMSIIFFNLLFIPLYCWSMFFTSLLLIMSLPVLAGLMTMVIFESHMNTLFFDPLSGGDMLSFQHLFWFSGHPEVYILMLPAFGLISEILSLYSQSIIFGSDSMMIALLMISFLGCMVWGHHMYMVGFDMSTKAYFTASTSIIAIPTSIKMLNWIATIWSSSFYLITPLLFMIGFLFSFSFGGLTGIMLANSILDMMLHDSYFVVSHFHFVLSLGAVYTIFAAFYNYYLYLMFYFNDLLGRIFYIMFFINSNLLFMPMHVLGINGMPSSCFDYNIIFIKFHWLNTFSLIGLFFSSFLFVFSIIISSSRLSMFYFLLSLRSSKSSSNYKSSKIIIM